MIDDEWRRWIAENLLLDASPEHVHAVLIEHGFEREHALCEIDSTLNSPYFLAGARLRNRLRKREWMFSVYGELNRMRRGADEIERHAGLSRDAFYEQFYFQNRPVIVTGMIDSWPARRRWNFDYFRARCARAEVEVQFGREADANYEINQPSHRRAMRFGDYVDLVERAGVTNDFYMTANNASRNRVALAALWDDVPPIGEYLDAAAADAGYFWFGPAGTKTPFHHDLTNNLMAQVIGRKRVLLVPFTDTAHMYNHLHCYSQVDGGALDVERFPSFEQAHVIECTLEPGELLFLPIGWWHYVEALDASVTMTYTSFLERNDFARTYSTYREL
ncbi:cupin-like domain-containing protein [Paraburkholderia phymatum]|uniref:Transcription factor jumonji jmjC domain protein n=1 Tax=Paraburkholderia phymatum (strain DSM 17167 / CIP 108236 / LMG 21445 / STM815) TaxID=391038 RepID=B2JK20_PARP8|nr:cupin-like domain-containing protein [Paraburkholderia phymatum]ACC69307.1 transcription factor jumonji jmjC domain protein [Paraburkholderia phymatum STM815]